MRYCALKREKNIFSSWVDLHMSSKFDVERKTFFYLELRYILVRSTFRKTAMLRVIDKPPVSLGTKNKIIMHID